MRILTTLAENDYFLGMAALINSVIKQGGYIDRIVVGYRGELPAWLPPLKQSKFGKSCILNSGIELDMIQVDGDLHMVHEKPRWFKYLTEVLEPNGTEYYFFDSDIVVLKRMSFFGEWVKQGVAMCEDVNYDMSADHPIRKQWIKLAQEDNIHVQRDINRYYNSGFLGWSRDTAAFVDDWSRCFTSLSRASADMKIKRKYDRTNAVFSANQDSLNLAAMTTKLPISTMGPEAMSFHNGLNLMSHPISAKPWKRKFIKEFFSGVPPRATDVIFWQHLNGTELKPVSNSEIKGKLLLFNILRGLSRLYKAS